MTGWDADSAEWYAERYGEYATNRLGIDAVALQPQDRVLDIGCGTGAALRHAARRVTHGELVGVDPVPRMLEIAEERRGNCPIAFRLGTASALPAATGSWDVVLAFDSMDHWASVAEGLAEVRRVLAPGGRFVVVKDASVPASVDVAAALGQSGFIHVQSRSFDGDVPFHLWVARTEPA